MDIFITQYISENRIEDGPCIYAESLQSATEQANFLNLEIIGRMKYDGDIEELRTIH